MPSLKYLQIRNLFFYFLIVYRPPSTSIATFFEEFQSLLESIHLTNDNLAITSNFNIHLDTTFSKSKTLHSLINLFDLIQKVNFLTHTLDLVLTKSNNENTSYVHTTDALSGHFFYTVNVTTSRSQTDATGSFCKYHRINKGQMKTASSPFSIIIWRSMLFTTNITQLCQASLTNILHLTLNMSRQSTHQDG